MSEAPRSVFNPANEPGLPSDVELFLRGLGRMEPGKAFDKRLLKFNGAQNMSKGLPLRREERTFENGRRVTIEVYANGIEIS